MKERFETFTLLLSKINRSIRKIKTEEMNEFNLKSNHVSCLFYLFKMGKLTATDLCELCQEDKATTSRLLEHLESNNYVTCDSSQKKRYNSYFVLTEKGVKLGKFISDKINKILDEASIGLTEENRKIMYDSLTLISNNLDKICGNY
ncbi:MAG: winged helix-turn-helix transcriptional regulator [Clostridia bacterium]|nr:winged helix-turn-helix transcriptional regulator [Clostridia bacterium]